MNSLLKWTCALGAVLILFGAVLYAKSRDRQKSVVVYRLIRCIRVFPPKSRYAPSLCAKSLKVFAETSNSLVSTSSEPW